MKRAALALALLSLASCGDQTGAGSGDPGGASGPASPTGDELYAEATVLESNAHGPQLCLGGVAESFPPQCGGPDLVGWDWGEVGAFDRVSGTTWGGYVVIGRYDAEAGTFTLTRPAVPSSEYDGPVPQPPEPPPAPAPEDRLSRTELEELHRELFDRTDAVYADAEQGRIALAVVHDDGTLQQQLDDEYGVGVVVVTSVLQPYPG